jgi:sugar O-acyltransferase (sialic acid O-acetyltransferase NeuD family)
VTELIGVFGTGGCGRGILPLLRTGLNAWARLVFVEDTPGSAELNGQQVLGWRSFLEDRSPRKSMCLAIADPRLRSRLHDRCNEAGISIVGATAQSVVTLDDVKIGEGACLSPFVTLTSNISIGKCFHANLYSYVEHDCRIGDFVTFGPGAKCNGNVVIDDFAYVGSNAVIKQGRPGAPLVIGKGAILGMGAVVTRSVMPGATVVGNPARVMAPEA